MRKVVSTSIVLSALLAWSALSVGQNTPPVQVAQGAAGAATTTTGGATAAEAGVLGTGLGVTEATVLGVVAIGTAAAVSNTDDTTPATAAATATR